MKKLICLLAGAALLGACEQQTEVAAPATPAPKPMDTRSAIVPKPTMAPGAAESLTSSSDAAPVSAATPTP